MIFFREILKNIQIREVREFMGKDQGMGGAILAVCVIVIAGCLVLVVDPGLFSLNAAEVRLDAVCFWFRQQHLSLS
jgi:hypothetical protein